ncbi:hypothetical protein GCM10010336_52520 [Streptomyces goshikiensis]|nr:hypothetical protein GCM10010336_52520 [Streptomyces goshikiensis]
MVAAVGELQPAETESVLAPVQRGKQPGLLGDEHIALQPRLEPAPGIGQRAPYGAFGLAAQFIETLIERGDELLLIPEFLD